MASKDLLSRHFDPTEPSGPLREAWEEKLRWIYRRLETKLLELGTPQGDSYYVSLIPLPLSPKSEQVEYDPLNDLPINIRGELAVARHKYHPYSLEYLMSIYAQSLTNVLARDLARRVGPSPTEERTFKVLEEVTDVGVTFTAPEVWIDTRSVL